MSKDKKAPTVGLCTPAGFITIDLADVERNWAALVVRNAELEALVERLKQEAQIHSGEARAHEATVRECYQSATGGTGEPATWNGAKPIERVISAASDLADAVNTTIGRALDNGEVTPKELDALQDAVDTFRAVRRGAYYPVSDVERRAVAMSNAKPGTVVVLTLYAGQQLAYFERELIPEHDRRRAGYITIAKFLNGKPVKE